MLVSGERVPSFKVTDSDGNDVSDEIFKGNRTLLFFYPKASTSG